MEGPSRIHSEGKKVNFIMGQISISDVSKHNHRIRANSDRGKQLGILLQDLVLQACQFRGIFLHEGPLAALASTD